MDSTLFDIYAILYSAKLILLVLFQVAPFYHEDHLRAISPADKLESGWAAALRDPVSSERSMST